MVVPGHHGDPRLGKCEICPADSYCPGNSTNARLRSTNAAIVYAVQSAPAQHKRRCYLPTQYKRCCCSRRCAVLSERMVLGGVAVNACPPLSSSEYEPLPFYAPPMPCPVLA
eukprot:648123-Rhodomonas_salina.4